MDCGRKNSSSSITAFQRQPARLLIIEAAPPWWSETCAVLCDALDNFLTLVSRLNGPCRLPLLSVYAFASQQKCLLPFVRVRGNLPRLHSCVETLRSIPSEGVTVELARVGQMLRQAVLDSPELLQQCLRFLGTGIQANSDTSVEVTVVTSRPGQGMVRLLKNVLKDDDLGPVTSFLVVQLCSEPELLEVVLPNEEPQEACSSGKHYPSQSMCFDCVLFIADRYQSRVLVDLRQVENNVFAVEEMFKEWLQEYQGDTEHIQLLLPSEHECSDPVHIKCDTRERLISPSLLPLNSPEKPESLCDVMSVSQMPRILRAIKVIYTSGLCQSVLYGLPLVVYPTGCSRLDWNEIELNQQTFQALNLTLGHRGQVLLLQEAPTEMPKGGGSGLFSFCILQPCPSLTMLLKPVVCRELLLPCAFPAPMREPLPEASLFIKRCLGRMDEEDVFGPSSLGSNLYQYLRTVPGTKRQCPSSASSMQPATQTYQRQPPGGGKATASTQPRMARQLGTYNKVKVTVAPKPSPLLRPPPVLKSRQALPFVSRSSRDVNVRASPPVRQEGSDEDGDAVTLGRALMIGGSEERNK
ncbi:meiosis 1 arrest protein isoform X1 [Phyllopteryx taeniolatus]|uniref:meiosis 1 arrest protein isoform X1 n=1 Tax=Phyllopteryx taeniolatus TaxID=161469 RepID=UPI002AD3D7BF|nr:meiosis 1 arrest protein isoform X1 [Phyllopteryx taeniolatus]